MSTNTVYVREATSPSISTNSQHTSTPQSWLGKPYPIGATFDGKGTNFALFSENAQAVELCLFDSADPSKETARIRILEQTDYVWHIYLPDCKAGQLYGYRVHGPFDPKKGLLFNPSKVLLDPYAKAFSGEVIWNPAMFGYDTQLETEDRFLHPNREDNAAYIMKSVVIDPSFDWQDDALPRIPMQDTLIYEMHVKGFSMLNEKIEPHLRGTYAGLATQASIDYLKQLGVTTLELMPVHQFVHDTYLLDKGLRNYWGYNTIGFFAPHNEYATVKDAHQAVVEFKHMVKQLHKAGIEVILDVVYTHSAEGNHFGPTLSFKGIDNASYFRLVEDQPMYYKDFTGVGNTFNVLHAHTLQLIMDSLRYWVTDMHVDGFRFDLAPTLARGMYEVGKLSSFLDAVHQDPILSQVKLIAEPWDMDEGGYQVGNFPVKWAEWNDRYRNCIRKFWKGGPVPADLFAYRLSGNNDLYQTSGRLPMASINFVASHDGFTLHDLVSYSRKHNQANDPTNEEPAQTDEADSEEEEGVGSKSDSWNCGVEGPTHDPQVVELREKQKRNFLATLFFSQGVPMLCGGDEYGRTQQGNDNAYCQDNEISWHDWNWTERQNKQVDFARQLIQIRKDNPILSRRQFFGGKLSAGNSAVDIRWLRPDGKEMTDAEWNNESIQRLGMLLDGSQIEEYDSQGNRIKMASALLLVNNQSQDISFTLPKLSQQVQWCLWVDTHTAQVSCGETVAADQTIALPARSLQLYLPSVEG